MVDEYEAGLEEMRESGEFGFDIIAENEDAAATPTGTIVAGDNGAVFETGAEKGVAGSEEDAKFADKDAGSGWHYGIHGLGKLPVRTTVTTDFP